MKRLLKPKYTETDIGVNPHIDKLIIPINRVTLTDRYKRDEDVLINDEMDLEDTPFSKLYASVVCKDKLYSMSSRAKELYLWFVYEIASGEDNMWLNRNRFMKENNVSLNTLKGAVMDLISMGIISYTIVKDVYFINPQYFFRGSRVAKYPDNLDVTIDSGARKKKNFKK